MKKHAQDLYPYDATIVGLKAIFQTIGDDSFLVNAPSFILATDQVLTIGKEYIIFDTPTETGIKMSDVVLVDAYYYEGNINLIVQDIRSQRVFTISHCLECPENDYSTWILVDLDYFIDRMNAKAIKQYCGNCNDTKKKPNAEINSKSSRDDLLEFEF